MTTHQCPQGRAASLPPCKSPPRLNSLIQKRGPASPSAPLTRSLALVVIQIQSSHTDTHGLPHGQSWEQRFSSRDGGTFLQKTTDDSHLGITKDEEQLFSGTINQSPLTGRSEAGFSVFITFTLVHTVSVNYFGMVFRTGNQWNPSSSETAGLLWLHLCLLPVAVLCRPKVTSYAAHIAAISLV